MVAAVAAKTGKTNSKWDHPDTPDTRTWPVTGAKSQEPKSHSYVRSPVLYYMLLTLIILLLSNVPLALCNLCNSVSTENVIRPVCHVCVNSDFNNSNSTFISLNMDQVPAPRPIQGIRAPHVLNVEGNVQENWKIFKQKWNN